MKTLITIFIIGIIALALSISTVNAQEIINAPVNLSETEGVIVISEQAAKPYTVINGSLKIADDGQLTYAIGDETYTGYIYSEGQ